MLGYEEASSLYVYHLHSRESLEEGQVPQILQHTASDAPKHVASQSSQACILAGKLLVPGHKASSLGADLVGDKLVVLTATGCCVVYDLTQPALQQLINGERLPTMVRLSHHPASHATTWHMYE